MQSSFEFGGTNGNAYMLTYKRSPRRKIISLVPNIPLKYTYSCSLRTISFFSLAFTVNTSSKIVVRSKTESNKVVVLHNDFHKVLVRERERMRDDEIFCRIFLRDGSWTIMYLSLWYVCSSAARYRLRRYQRRPGSSRGRQRDFELSRDGTSASESVLAERGRGTHRHKGFYSR